MKLRRLHVAGAIIIAAWLASLGWLVQREYLSGATPGDVAASARVVPGTAFYSVYSHGTQIGVASVTVDTLGGEVRLSERLDVALPGAASAQRVRFATDVHLSPALELRSLTSSVGGTLPPSELRVLRGAGDTVVFELDRRGVPTRIARRALGTALPGSAIPLRVAVRARPIVGQLERFVTIDPIDGSVSERRYVVADSSEVFVVDSARFDSSGQRWAVAHGAGVAAWRLDELDADVPVRIWIDAQGFVVRAESELGFLFERTAFEIAQLNYRARKPANSVRDMTTRTRRVRPDTVVTEDTAAELLLPSDAPEVVAVARAAVHGLAPDPAARALLRSVARGVRPAPPASAPDALLALRSRRGDDASRALLFVSLARAAGIPARVVSGARSVGGRWEPRVWAEVFADGWTAVDPRTGAWPADTALVRLRTGGSGHPLQLFPLIARLPSPAPAS